MRLSKNIALFMFLYFIQGLPYGFQARFLPVFLRSQGLSLTNLGFFKLLLAPWLCKALWAPLVDRYASKRKWLLWSIFGLIITCAFSCFISPKNIPLLCIVLLSLNVCAATQDIAVDGIAVALLASDELGQGNTAQVVGYKIGSIFGGGVLVWFIDIIGWTGLFALLTLLYIESWMFVYVSPKLRAFGSKNVHENRSEDIDNGSNGDGSDGTEANKTSKDILEDFHDQCDDDVEEIPVEESQDDVIDDTDVGNEDDSPLVELYVNKEQDKRNEVFKLLSDVWKTPGTKWLIVFVVVYKLGEQGVTGMLPLYLVDKNVSTNDVTFWAGMLGQGLSILGSILGGWIIACHRLPVWLVMNQVCLLRVMPMGVLLQIVLLWDVQLLSGHILYYGAVAGYCVLMVFSGMITTATFTCMMQSTKLAPSQIQTTHYTCLSTLEVLGKLTFASLSGYLVDVCGYMAMFLIYVVLSVVIIPLFKKFPGELQGDVVEETTVKGQPENEAGKSKID